MESCRPYFSAMILSLFTDGRFMKKICLKRICVIVCWARMWLRLVSLDFRRITSDRPPLLRSTRVEDLRSHMDQVITLLLGMCHSRIADGLRALSSDAYNYINSMHSYSLTATHRRQARRSQRGACIDRKSLIPILRRVHS